MNPDILSVPGRRAMGRAIMGIDIRTEIVILRPREAVASYAMDYANDPVWIDGILEANLVTDPPFGKGSQVQRVATFMGRRMEYTPEVVEHVPGKLLVMRTDSPFDMTISYEFEDVDGGTLASVRIQGEGTGFYKLAGPLLSKTVQGRVAKDLSRLKELLEESGEAT